MTFGAILALAVRAAHLDAVRRRATPSSRRSLLEGNTSPQPQSPGARLIEVVAEASTIKGWRKVVIAGQTGSETFSFVSDEGSYMPGGEGTAPTPLTYFTAGVAL